MDDDGRNGGLWSDGAVEMTKGGWVEFREGAVHEKGRTGIGKKEVGVGNRKSLKQREKRINGPLEEDFWFVL